MLKIISIVVFALSLVGCGNGEKTQQLEREIAELKKSVNLPKQLAEEYIQIIEECKRLAEDPHTTQKQKDAIVKKAKIIRTKILSANILTPVIFRKSFDRNCSIWRTELSVEADKNTSD